MSLFPFFSSHPDRARKTPARKKAAPRIALEGLEERALMAANVISGYVYHDANTNGLFDPGESPIANTRVELRDSKDVFIAADITDANGFYEFDHDDRTDTTPRTITKTVEFPPTLTNFQLQGLLDQFDPTLGTLQSVEIKHEGTITSEIKVENTSTSSGSNINGTVAGTLTLTAPGVNNKLELSKYAGSFDAGTYDGALDYQGGSGTSFGLKPASGSDTLTLTGDAVQPYVGTGKVTVTENAVAKSQADGGGNLVANIESKAWSKVTVTYKYKPSDRLPPGTYRVVETQPPEYLDGQESSGGVVLNHAPGTDFIDITLPDNGVSTQNNFGELKPAKLSGHVYFDTNNNGSMDAGEQGIAGVKITATASVQAGVMQTEAVTDAAGFYEFKDLPVAAWTLTETQPAGFLDGKDKVGSLGGTATDDKFADITVRQGDSGTDYDFGEIKAASISGFVYVDGNNDGLRGPGEPGIPGTTVTLSGTDAEGNAVNLTSTTNPTGFYQFDTLKPGMYTVTETQPANYQDGKDSVGTKGGTLGNDVISAVTLGMGDAGEQYNFGEISPARADVGIDKQVSAAVVKPNEFLIYTMVVTNYGDYTAEDVVVTDALPAGEIFIAAAGPGWSIRYSNGVITARTASLAVGQSKTFKVKVQVTGDVDVLVNPAEVTSRTPDDNPNNNRDQVVTRVVLGPTEPFNEPPGILQTRTPYIGKTELLSGIPLPASDLAAKTDLAFVDGAYRTLTGQAANHAQLATAYQRLRAGTTRATLVAELWNSDAHRIYQATGLYRTYLGRTPTAGEMQNVVQSLRAGTPELSLAEGILASEEYQQRHPGANGLVTGYYRDIFKKMPDAAGKQALLQAMDSEPLAQVVRNLVYSDESLTHVVDKVFRQSLYRHASANEVSYWSGQIKAGAITADDLAVRLLGSQEFYQLAYNASR